MAASPLIGTGDNPSRSTLLEQGEPTIKTERQVVYRDSLETILSNDVAMRMVAFHLRDKGPCLLQRDCASRS